MSRLISTYLNIKFSPASRRAFFGKLGSLWCFLFGHVTTPVLATSSVVLSQLKNIQFPKALVLTKQVKLPETGGLEFGLSPFPDKCWDTRT